MTLGPAQRLAAQAGLMVTSRPRSLLTNGRGNPAVLGTPAEYKLWVVGDAEQSSAYAIDITWVRGPDW
jgi:hypothetical protein